jgi:hypothetical protein
MEVEYSLTLEDLRAFRRQHRRGRQKPPRKKLVPDWVVWPVLFLLLFFIFLTSEEPLAWLTRPWVLLLAGFVAGVVSIILLGVGVTRRAVRRFYDDPDNRWMFGSRRVSITPEGLHTTSAVSRGFYSWEGIIKVRETDDHAFLYISAEQAVVVPRRAFRNTDEFERFIDLVRRYRDEARLPDALPADDPPRPEGITARLPEDPSHAIRQRPEGPPSH